jgi:ABC-type transport system substrate-binding protein
MTRARVVLGAVVAAAIMAALPPVQLGAQAPATLAVAWTAAGTALDPGEPSTFLTHAAAYGGAFLVYNGLVRLSEEMTIGPELATSWSVGADGRSWVFKIRPGVLFQDGEPLTAQAIAEYLQHQLDASINPSNRLLWDPVTSISASGGSTVRIVTREPYGALLNTLAHGSGLVARRVASAQGTRSTTSPQVGTGPYQPDRWEAGKQLDLVRNGRYWGDRPGFDRIALRSVADPASRAAMIRDGRAQVADGIPPDQVAGLARVPGTTMTIKPALRTFGMAINLNRPMWQDIRVRQALNYAVNKELIVNALFHGRASVLHSPLAAQATGYADLGPWPYDPPRARRLLEDGGWKPAPPIGVRVRDGKSLELTLLTPRGVFPRDVEVTETLADYLRNVGFDIHFTYVDAGALWNQLLAAPDQYKWDLVLLGFDPVNGDGGFHLDALYRSNPDRRRSPLVRNVTWYANPQVDAWLSEGNHALDPRERAGSYAKAARQVWNDAPYLWLYAEDLIVATRNVRGVEVMPTGVTILRSARP